MFVPLQTLWDVLKYFWCCIMNSWSAHIPGVVTCQWYFVCCSLPIIQGEARRAVAPMSGYSGTSCHGPNLMHAIQQEKEPLKWELWDFFSASVRHWHDLQVATCCQLKDSRILKQFSFILYSYCCKSRKGTLDLDLTKYWTSPNFASKYSKVSFQKGEHDWNINLKFPVALPTGIMKLPILVESNNTNMWICGSFEGFPPKNVPCLGWYLCPTTGRTSGPLPASAAICPNVGCGPCCADAGDASNKAWREARRISVLSWLEGMIS